MQKVLLIGTGNLAWHLAPNLEKLGYQVILWTRKPKKDDLDWRSSKAEFPSAISSKLRFDICFLAVPDDYIASISRRLSNLLTSDTPVVHTSGATAITTISNYFSARGALWPIRSLRKGEPVADWRDLPLVYCSDNPAFEVQLAKLSTLLSDLTYRLDDEQRAQLHLAAVFSNNFTTWLCQIAYELCQEKEIPFSALVPIIKNTFSKVDANEPALRQTGAAIRGDQKTMDRHLDLLENQPQYAALYRQISAMIGAWDK